MSKVEPMCLCVNVEYQRKVLLCTDCKGAMCEKDCVCFLVGENDLCDDDSALTWSAISNWLPTELYKILSHSPSRNTSLWESEKIQQQQHVSASFQIPSSNASLLIVRKHAFMNQKFWLIIIFASSSSVPFLFPQGQEHCLCLKILNHKEQ